MSQKMIRILSKLDSLVKINRVPVNLHKLCKGDANASVITCKPKKDAAEAMDKIVDGTASCTGQGRSTQADPVLLCFKLGCP